MRVTIFWYIVGALVLFLGSPDWAEAGYTSLLKFPWVPELELQGISTAAAVQWKLLTYWTLPVLLLWGVSLLLGVVGSEVGCRLQLRKQAGNLKPSGVFWGVAVPSYSLGRLPLATTPKLTGQPVVFATDKNKQQPGVARVQVTGLVGDAVKLLTPSERQFCEELIQLMLATPEHYAGLGHGVGLLEHTLNVVAETAAKCNSEFRLPLLAALAHDVGKLITFKSDGNGGWVRKGLHSRESARIMATLPGFQELPELHQRGLLLAVKYDHAPSKMPELRGDKEASMLALRIISALAQADRMATAAEKDRHLEKLQPEDLLWKDFADFLREAPVVQRGKKGAANQVNNPPDSPYLYVYEAPWRDAAIRRMPPEVAAALDLSRRDTGKIAKYTKILVERLRKEGLLVESHEGQVVTESNPLWDIQSGTGEKAVVLRGILVIRADELWTKLNYRLSVKSPFPVQMLAPNADAGGHVNRPPVARDQAGVPDVSDGLKLADVQSADALAAIGLTAPAEGSPASMDATAGAAAKPKTRARGGFKAPDAPTGQDSLFGLRPAAKAPAVPARSDLVSSEVPAQAAQEGNSDSSTNSALAFFTAQAVESADEPTTALYEDPTVPSDVAPAPVAERVTAPARPVEAANTVSQEPLSRAERREGLALADSATVGAYPELKEGDKYYTERSRAVQAGLKKPGSRYKGDREKPLDLTGAGPHRVKRRVV